MERNLKNKEPKSNSWTDSSLQEGARRIYPGKQYNWLNPFQPNPFVTLVNRLKQPEKNK